MFHIRHALIGASAALAAALAGAHAAPLIEKNISQEEVLMGYQSVLAECRKSDSTDITVVIVDRAGLVALAARSDNAAPHNLDLARRKAYTARTFRVPSLVWRDRSLPGTQAFGQRELVDVIPLGGGYPITVGNDVVGGVGVSGSKGGQPGDEACAKAGADAIAADMQ
jgi:uncharacterized protein GlcG (DUF336 family)